MHLVFDIFQYKTSPTPLYKKKSTMALTALQIHINDNQTLIHLSIRDYIYILKQCFIILFQFNQFYLSIKCLFLGILFMAF